ncbi:hypothetical protein [Actinomadura kijaniata]|uniref:hypothetical protein n=1 Tax=Actinomadura kijaniata TaxID=46161 RepID=UPI0012F93F6B|nr:hypothetical protein [Actinomadura kijaniata]
MVSVTPDVPEFRVVSALYGFEQAYQRFLDQANNPNVPAVVIFAPLAEALWWAISADEGFFKLDKAGYRSRRDATEEGSHLRALLFARNRCGHQRALVIERSGLTAPLTPPVTPGVHIRWRRLSELPPPDPGFNDPDGEAAYEVGLASKPVERALSQIAKWFTTARQQAGTRFGEAQAAWPT